MDQELAPGVRMLKPSYLRERKTPRTAKQQFVVAKIAENSGSGVPQTMKAIMLEAGYAENTAATPQRVTASKGFQEMLVEIMPPERLTQVHETLLQSMKLDHMTFPLGPKGEDDPDLSGASPNDSNAIEKAGVPVERTSLTDGEIKVLIKDVGGQVRRIVHGDTARHVYFWAPNDKARHDALKLAYDLMGLLGKKDPDPNPAGNTYNTYIQNNVFDPNAPDSRQLVDNTLDILMSQTQRKNIETDTTNEG